MMNFQDKLQTTAPSIRYEGDIRPEQAQLRQQQAQAMQQMQQQAMMQQPQGRMPAGRMPPMAMGGSITGPTIQGQNGIAGLNMPGYNSGGTVGSMRDRLKSKGYDWIDDADDDTVRQIFDSEEGTFSIPSRSSKAYGGIMGQDGRKQYGIGSWFQEKIMDPIKKNPIVSAAAAALAYDQFGKGLPGGGNKYASTFISDLFKKGNLATGAMNERDATEDGLGRKVLKGLGSVGGDLLANKGMLSAIGGAAAGLFSDRLNQSEDIEADRGVGIGIQNIGKSANLLSPIQGMEAGLRFLPELETRKYSPAMMAAQYGSDSAEPIATANLADGGRAFDIPDYSYKNKMMDPDMMEQIKRLIQGGMGKGMGRSDMEKSVLMRMPDMTMGYAEGGRLESFGAKQKQLREISKKLQEINQAMMSAEAEELVELMQESMVLREQMKQLSASPDQGVEDNLSALLPTTSDIDQYKSIMDSGSTEGYNIYKPDRTKENYPVEDVSMDEMVSMPNNNDRALMMSGRMMGKNPFANVDIPSIRMQGDAGSAMGEATMFEEYDQKAEGGIMETEQSEMLDLGGMEKDYREEGGFVPIGEYEKKDDVPARLSVNEFVFTADAVRGAGDGDIDKGAERLQGIMKQLEQQGKPEGTEMIEVSERLSEVV